MPVQEITGGERSYFNQNVVIECSWHDNYSGDKKFSYPQIQFGGKQIADVGKYRQGDMVEVSFMLQGNRYQDRNTGEEKFFTIAKGYRIEPLNNRRKPYNEPPKDDAPFPVYEDDVAF